MSTGEVSKFDKMVKNELFLNI